MFIYSLPNYSNNNNSSNNDNKIVKKRLKLFKEIEILLKSLLIEENKSSTKLSFYSSLKNNKDYYNSLLINTNSNINTNNNNNGNNNNNINIFYKKLKQLFWDKFIRNKENDKLFLIDFLNLISTKGNNKFFQLFNEILKLYNKKDDDNENDINNNKWYKNFFNNDKNRIINWFDHFQSVSNLNGVQNKYGSLALERYILSERNDIWDLLHWKEGMRSIPPNVIVQKKELLSQLDIISTVHSIIDNRPDFFNTNYFQQSISNNVQEFISVDKPFIINQIIKMMEELDNQDNEETNNQLTEIINQFLWSYCIMLGNNGEFILNQFDYNQFNQNELLLLSTNFQLSTFNNNNSTIENIVLLNCNWDSFETMIIYNNLTPYHINRLLNTIQKNKKQLKDEQLYGYYEFKEDFDKLLKEYKQTTKDKDHHQDEKEMEIIENIKKSHLQIGSNLLKIRENSLTDIIKFILIESFIYFYLLKIQLPNQSDKELLNYFNENNIPITIENNDENSILLSSSDEEDKELSKKKRKKNKKHGPSKKLKSSSLFGDEEEEKDKNSFSRQFKYNNSIINLNDIPQILYNLKFKEMMLHFLK